MMCIQGFLAGLLAGTPPQQRSLWDGVEAGLGISAKVAQDELVDAFQEKFAADAKPRREQTLEEHDKQHHPGGFDPETETCKFRDKMKQKDAVDLIYATSDIHQSGIEDITDTESGTIVVAGDFMEKAKHHADFKNAGKWWDEHFLPWCDSHKNQQIVIIGGNCDKWLYENRDKVEWPKNVHYLDDSLSEVNGMKVYGTSWCPHNMNGAWEVDDEQLEEEFSKIPEGLDILVTHVPPKGEGLDLDRDDKNHGHFGSEALTKAILEKKPKIVLCGHVHRGSHKPVKIGDSIVMNVSRVDDDRYEQSFHGRRIGVERTDNGLGFLVDMDYTGKVAQPKKEDVPDEIVKLRDALREAAKSINHHVEKGDFTPNPKRVGKVNDSIQAAEKAMKNFSGDKRKMIDACIKSFKDSEESGFKKPMRRVGKLYEGDRNGAEERFAFSWEKPFHGGGHFHYGGGHGGYSFSSAMSGHSQGGLFGEEPIPYSKSSHVNQFGKYKDPWKGGMSAAQILAAWKDKNGQSEEVEPINLEGSPFEDGGIPDNW